MQGPWAGGNGTGQGPPLLSQLPQATERDLVERGSLRLFQRGPQTRCWVCGATQASPTYLSDFPVGKDMLLFPIDCLSFLGATHFCQDKKPFQPRDNLTTGHAQDAHRSPAAPSKTPAPPGRLVFLQLDLSGCF